MATKSITITTDAYEQLMVYKGQKESFSDVISKLTKKSSLRELIGILTPKEAAELKGYRKEINDQMQKEVDATASKLR